MFGDVWLCFLTTRSPLTRRFPCLWPESLPPDPPNVTISPTTSACCGHRPPLLAPPHHLSPSSIQEPNHHQQSSPAHRPGRNCSGHLFDNVSSMICFVRAGADESIAANIEHSAIPRQIVSDWVVQERQTHSAGQISLLRASNLEVPGPLQ